MKSSSSPGPPWGLMRQSLDWLGNPRKASVYSSDSKRDTYVDGDCPRGSRPWLNSLTLKNGSRQTGSDCPTPLSQLPCREEQRKHLKQQMEGLAKHLGLAGAGHLCHLLGSLPELSKLF